MLIREARLLAGLSQSELGERVGRDRAQIARWERDAVQPSFETLRQLVRACGYDLAIGLEPYASDEREAERIRKRLLRSPQERVRAMLTTHKR
jgi:transcriptional regulator with XRE-family HTH domain